jgi:hypothetical protein
MCWISSHNDWWQGAGPKSPGVIKVSCNFPMDMHYLQTLQWFSLGLGAHKHHLQVVWSHTGLRIYLMALHKEILDIQNSKLPIIHPGEVANRVLSALQGFNPFNILRHTFWILMGSLFFCSLCSVCSQSSADLECPRSSGSEQSSTMST